MEKDLDYSIIPFGFMHCINSECTKGNDCMRRKAMLLSVSGPKKISIVNPVHIPANTEDCPHFFSNRKIRYALGITHLLDNIAYPKAKSIKRDINRYLGKNTYYRIVNKERLIAPSEQNLIRQLFINNGIEEEPLYDEYVEKYDWTGAE